MSAALGSLGQSMYVATKEDTLWLQNVQRALHTRSREHPDYVFEKLWGLVTDLRNLRIAFARVQRNHGARTVGIDRVTVRKVLQSRVMPFLDEIRKDLRGGTCRLAPVPRVLIPKAGHPGKFRPLGSPTVKARSPRRSRPRRCPAPRLRRPGAHPAARTEGSDADHDSPPVTGQ